MLILFAPIFKVDTAGKNDQSWIDDKVDEPVAIGKPFNKRTDPVPAPPVSKVFPSKMTLFVTKDEMNPFRTKMVLISA